MDAMAELAALVAERLKERSETVAISESSTGGLISAALLAVPGASAYFLGGAVVYTRAAREQFSATWALSETGAAGPTGNRYGDAAGHSCIAISGAEERAITIETGSNDRAANMQAFATAALDLIAATLGRA